jgi:methyl-accepting chemotaxis protein
MPGLSLSGTVIATPIKGEASDLMAKIQEIFSNLDENATEADFQQLARELLAQVERSREKLKKAFEDRDIEIPQGARESYTQGVEALLRARELYNSGSNDEAMRVAKEALSHFGDAYRALIGYLGEAREEVPKEDDNATDVGAGLTVANERAYAYLEKLNTTAHRLQGEGFDMSPVYEQLRKAWTYLHQSGESFEEGEARAAVRSHEVAREALGQANSLMSRMVKAYKEVRAQRFIEQAQVNIRNLNGTLERLQTSLEAGKANEVRAVLANVENRIDDLRRRLNAANLESSLDELHAAVNDIDQGLSQLNGEVASELKAMNMVETRIRVLNASAYRLKLSAANGTAVSNQVQELLQSSREYIDEITEQMRAGNSEAVRELLRRANTNVVEANRSVRQSTEQTVRPEGSSESGAGAQDKGQSSNTSSTTVRP